MQVKIHNESRHALPQYATDAASGMDLRANLHQSATLRPFERSIIPTGLKLEIPPGYEGQVRPRSGLAAKEGVTVLNAPGTIDADYRGEVKVLLVNLSHESVDIQDGDRIAQLVFAPVQQITWEAVEELAETDRGQSGYGHTGKA